MKCRTPLPRIRIEARSVINDAAPQAQGKLGPQFRRGQVVGGRYTVLNLIGQGGMGSIYKVHDNTLGEDVALKTLLPQFLNDKVVLERFYNEAKIARRLAHQNIVRVHDIGEDGKVLYISMEYVQGMSLREVLDNLKPGERMPIAQTLRIFDELCAALEYAHQFTIHRDIKPENVMLSQDGNVRLMDFGISKLMSNTRLTGASVVMGTPFYMSPEQIRNSRDVDARSDVYSVGVMLYEILTGNVPTGVPKPASQLMSDVPPAMDKIVTKCVEPNPKERYQNASELRRAFAPIRDSIKSGVSIPKIAVTETSHRNYSPKKVGGALTALLIIGLAAWSLAAAEKHRSTLPDFVPANNGAVVGTEGPPAFTTYAAIQEALRISAEANGTQPGVHNALDAGDALWADAQTASEYDESLATTLAGYAFQCYLALILARDLPADMVFITPDSESNLGGFFINRYEVTVGQYRSFVKQEEAFEPLPSFLNVWASDFPAAGVSCLDAMAFAAAMDGPLPCALPSEAQWARAAQFDRDSEAWIEDTGLDEDGELLYKFHFDGELKPEAVGAYGNDQSIFLCRDMVGSVSEWTRTSKDNPPHFGSMVTVCGGNYGEDLIPPANARWQFRYENPGKASAPFIGFRCVMELPTDAATAQGLLARYR